MFKHNGTRSFLISITKSDFSLCVTLRYPMCDFVVKNKKNNVQV